MAKLKKIVLKIRLSIRVYARSSPVPKRWMFYVRGVLGNKCAGQHNLKTVHFRETLASGNFLKWLSGICVFFCSPLSTLGRRGQAFM